MARRGLLRGAGALNCAWTRRSPSRPELAQRGLDVASGAGSRSPFAHQGSDFAPVVFRGRWSAGPPGAWRCCRGSFDFWRWWAPCWTLLLCGLGSDLFGLAVAPSLNDLSVKEVLRVLAEQGVDLLDFVDDLFGNSPSLEGAWALFERAVSFFLKMGILVSDKPGGIRPSFHGQGYYFRRGVVCVNAGALVGLMALLNSLDLACHV